MNNVGFFKNQKFGSSYKNLSQSIKKFSTKKKTISWLFLCDFIKNKRIIILVSFIIIHKNILLPNFDPPYKQKIRQYKKNWKTNVGRKLKKIYKWEEYTRLEILIMYFWLMKTLLAKKIQSKKKNSKLDV